MPHDGVIISTRINVSDPDLIRSVDPDADLDPDPRGQNDPQATVIDKS